MSGRRMLAAVLAAVTVVATLVGQYDCYGGQNQRRWWS